MIVVPYKKRVSGHEVTCIQRKVVMVFRPGFIKVHPGESRGEAQKWLNLRSSMNRPKKMEDLGQLIAWPKPSSVYMSWARVAQIATL